MKKYNYIFPVLSYLILAAHSLRTGNIGFVALWISLIFILPLKERWVRYVTQGALILASLIWIRTAYLLIQSRLLWGMPWIRLLVIMTLTLAVMLYSLYIFSRSGASERYGKNPEYSKYLTAIFFITFILLEFIRTIVPIKLLLADRFLPGMGTFEIFLLSLYAVWIGGKILRKGNSKKVRPLIWSLFSFVFFLQLALGLAGFHSFLMTGKLHLPVPALIISGPVYRGSDFFMPILFLSTIILTGPAWCSYLCYIGAWDDRFSRFNEQKTKSLPIWSKNLRIIILLSAILIPFGLRYIPDSGAYAFAIAAFFGIAGIAVMVFISARKGIMIHCSVYCPIGITANILGKLSPWRLRIHNSCSQCRICSKECRYNALTSDDLKRLKPGISCTLCGDCLSACPGSHISYSFPGLSEEKSRLIFISVIIIIHTIFLAVARI